MSINSSVQQLGTSLGSFFAGLVVVRSASGRLEHYSLSGKVAIGFTFMALFLASRIQPKKPFLKASEAAFKE